MELSGRQGKILSRVVREFVESGEPVGSKLIADEIGVSSATVRNEMAELIELGLLEQPHTSAGRVPSPLGYRVFVDRLMVVPNLSTAERRDIDLALGDGSADQEQVLTRAVRFLAGATHCAALVTAPQDPGAKVRAVQLVQTGRRTAMLLLMSSAGMMKSRVFRCDYDLTGEMLRVFFRALNDRVTGVAARDINPAFLQSLGVSLGPLVSLVPPVLSALLETAQDTLETRVIPAGQLNLLYYPELEHRRMMDLLENTGRLESLLSRRSGRVTVRIGRETELGELRDAALCMTGYRLSGGDAGTLAVLGPMRMDYPRCVALLEYLAAETGRILTWLQQED